MIDWSIKKIFKDIVQDSVTAIMNHIYSLILHNQMVVSIYMLYSFL